MSLGSTPLALYLGLDVEHDRDLLWIAQQGLEVNLPPQWKVCQNVRTDDIFYHNVITQESTWAHPCDAKYRALLDEEREARVTIALSLDVKLTTNGLRISATNLAGVTKATVDVGMPGQVTWSDVRDRLVKSLSFPEKAVPRFISETGTLLGHSHLSRTLADAFGWQTLRL